MSLVCSALSSWMLTGSFDIEVTSSVSFLVKGPWMFPSGRCLGQVHSHPSREKLGRTKSVVPTHLVDEYYLEMTREVNVFFQGEANVDGVNVDEVNVIAPFEYWTSLVFVSPLYIKTTSKTLILFEFKITRHNLFSFQNHTSFL